MSKDINVNFKDLPKELSQLGHKIAPYVPLIFFVLVATVYGAILLRITVLSSAKPDATVVSTQVSELTPHIDTSSVQKLQSLEDNSVNVQSLFNDARGNPFGE
jgi:hypothetical protein